MRIRGTEYSAVASRAKRRFPDHTLEIAYAVCLPVYELRLKVTEMAEHDLSTAARFVLQLANIGIVQPAEIGRLLGLQDGYLSSAAAELLGQSLVVQRPARTSLPRFLRQPLIQAAVIRNELGSAHGAGTEPREVTGHLAHYAINVTASAILLADGRPPGRLPHPRHLPVGVRLGGRDQVMTGVRSSLADCPVAYV